VWLVSGRKVICHGIPDMRELQDGDIVNIDVSTFYNGYHGDLNEVRQTVSSALLELLHRGRPSSCTARTLLSWKNDFL
jgi:hypothetical protein